MSEIAGQTLMFGCKKISENISNYYIKDPFVQSFKETCTIFTESHQLINVNKEIFKNLSELDELKISLLFKDVDKMALEFLSNDYEQYSFLTNSLKKYIVTHYPDEEYEESIYETWIDIFRNNYQKNMECIIKKQPVIFDRFLKDSFGLVYRDLQSLKNVANEIRNDVKTLNKKIDSFKHVGIDVDSETVLIDSTISAYRILFKKKEYQSCIEAIDENINNSRHSLSNESLSKLYGFKGACECHLFKYIDAESSFKKALELNINNSVALANLCKCYINNNEISKIRDYLEQFPDKNSIDYLEIKFYELFYLNNDIDSAESLLEENKEKFKTYNVFKARVLQQKLAPYDEIIELLKEYINKNPDDEIAQYEYLRVKISSILQNKIIHYYIGISNNFKLSISPAKSDNIDFEKIDYLISNAKELLNIQSLQPYRYDLMVMISLLDAEKGSQVIAKEYENEIIANIDNIKGDYELQNLCLFFLLLNNFDLAYIAYNRAEPNELSISLLSIVLFGLEKFEECHKLFLENDIKGEETLKLLSEYKSSDWTSFYNKIKNNYNELELNERLAFLHLCYDNQEFLFCNEKYEEETKYIILNDIIITSTETIIIDNKLRFFHKDTLANKLLNCQWFLKETKENFIIGLNVAINFYNEHKHADCLKVLERLSQFDSEHPKIKELYQCIDIANDSFEQLINEYEKGNKISNRNFVHLALEYVRRKNYDKADKIITQIKFIDGENINYYKAKIALLIETKQYTELFKIIEEAYGLYKDNLDINKIIFSTIMMHCKGVELPEKIRVINAKVTQLLLDNNAITKIEIKENDIDDLVQQLKNITVSENREKIEEIQNYLFEQYYNFLMPVQCIYQFVNKNKIDFNIIFFNTKEQRKMLFPPNRLNNSKAFKILEKQPKILISIEALFLIEEIELTNIVKEVFNIYISNYSKKEVDLYIHEVINNPSSGQLNISHDKILYSDNTEIHNKYKKFILSIIPNYHCINVQSDKINPDILAANERIPNSDLLNEAIVCSQDENMIVWVDGTLSNIYEEFNINCVSTLNIIEYLHVKNIITEDELSYIKTKLLKLNCEIIPFSASDLYNSLQKGIKEFELFMDSLNSKIFTPDSTIIVATEFIYKIETNKLSKFTLTHAIQYMFRKFMLLYPSLDFAVALFRKLFYNFPNLSNEILNELAINFYSYLEHEQCLALYKQLLISLKNNQRLIKCDSLMSKIIMTAPSQIKSSLIDFATQHCGYIQTILL